MWSLENQGATRRGRGKATTAKRAETGAGEWAREKLGFAPDGVQQRLLMSKGRRVILNCTRQWGKSTVTAAKAVYQATHEAESLTIAVSPSARQTGEFLRKASQFVMRLGMPVRGDGDNEMSLLLPNRSRIVGLPGNEATVRGFSAVSLLLVDEASRVEDELYRAVRPMLIVSDGALWLMSTPFGKRGFFYETWVNGGAEWERVQVKAGECPRIRKELLEEERRSLGDMWYRQEYECEFVDAVSGVFDRDLVEGAITREVKPLEFD